MENELIGLNFNNVMWSLGVINEELENKIREKRICGSGKIFNGHEIKNLLSVYEADYLALELRKCVAQSKAIAYKKREKKEIDLGDLMHTLEKIDETALYVFKNLITHYSVNEFDKKWDDYRKINNLTFEDK